MYYCIVCRQLHHPDEEHKKAAEDYVKFKTGFHYINDTLYPAGFCKPAEIQTAETQCATA